jgi:chaperonin cofactor prefoldin
MVNPESVEFRQRLDKHQEQLSELKGSVQELRAVATRTNTQATLQIAAIVISLMLSVFGSAWYQTNALEKRFDQIDNRFEQIEKRMEALERRMDRIERNLDELNKELRTQRQPASR